MNNKVQEKLRKLIEHQKSAEAIGNIHEAAAFAAKLQELLDKHNLSMSDIDMREQDKTMGRTDSKVSLRFTWKQFLMTAVAETNGCRLFMDYKKNAILIGTEPDRLVVLDLFDYFSDLGDALLTVYRKEHRALYGTIGGNFNKSFLYGYQYALGERLRRAHRESIENAQQSTALVFIGNKLAKADQFARDNMQWRNGKKKNLDIKDWGGFDAGRRAGNSVALKNQQMPAQKTGHLLGS